MCHTLPFLNFALALNVLHIAVAWFGMKVAWKDLITDGLLPTGLCLGADFQGNVFVVAF